MVAKGAERSSDALPNPQAAPTHHPGRIPKLYTLGKLDGRGFGSKDARQRMRG